MAGWLGCKASRRGSRESIKDRKIAADSAARVLRAYDQFARRSVVQITLSLPGLLGARSEMVPMI